jgi:4-amino-4-deoxy-L-arabinose transferase-like glycosyltransferase
MTPTPQVLSNEPSARSRAPLDRWGLVVLAVLAGWVFFFGLGRAELTDWDEAWHAQVASEILTSHDWRTLHYQGQPYFNKPPLTFWLKAIAFEIGGVNEASARFFPALFGWGTVILAAWLFGRPLGERVGMLAGLILCTSWLFTLHHAGRSGETDSTLIFFQLLTFAALWKARSGVRWFYAAGILTGLGWMTKGSTAYLPWVAGMLGVGMERWAAQCKSQNAKCKMEGTRHAIGGFALAVAITLPWQIFMLANYGRAFAQAFYVGEGALPAMQAIENHPGNPMFYILVFHWFFQPWFVLAAGTVIWTFWRWKSAVHPAIMRAIAWAAVVLVACTIFATKMVWYATPMLPALALLAAVGAVELCRRNGGWMLLAAIAGFAAVQLALQASHWIGQAIAVGLVVLVGWQLIRGSVVWDRWRSWLAALCLAVPLAVHFKQVYGEIVHGTHVATWDDLGVDDEPWRDVCRHLDRDLAGRPILLVGIPLNPAAYFYLHHLRQPVAVDSVMPEALGARLKTDGNAVIITRIEMAGTLGALVLDKEHSEKALAVMDFAR